MRLRSVQVCFRVSLCKKKIQEHKETFYGDKIRDLTGAVFKVTKDAQAEGLEVKKHLTEKHMILTLMDIFQAGLDTTTGHRLPCQLPGPTRENSARDQ